ncbi:MAG: HEPN domain-containing protein [Dehalococcoidia bacterium]|nr:HEPN domain-containing protein [Dehalococcoidia bacterium]
MNLDAGANLIDSLHSLAKSRSNMPRKGMPEFNFDVLASWLGKELADELLSSLDDIRVELIPRHAEDMALINAFWDDLVYEVSANSQTYLNRPGALDELVQKFSETWKKPLSEFEVLYSVDCLALGEETISLLGVEFFSPTDEALAQRAIPKADVAKWNKETESLTLAITRVEAASSNLAFDSGRDKVADAIALMRVAAMRGLTGRTATDELLQWTLSGSHLLRHVVSGEPQEGWYWGFRRQFGPLVDEIGDDICWGIEELELGVLSSLPENVQDRILRSIYWIAHSTTHEVADHKLVDLCTALEILLLPEGGRIRQKGDNIALRYNLLGGTLNPSYVKWMYGQRNAVVHGDQLPVVKTVDVWNLRMVCYQTARGIIQASVSRPNELSLKDLIALVETKEGLKTFIELSTKGIYEGDLMPQILKTARRKLKQLS